METNAKTALKQFIEFGQIDALTAQRFNNRELRYDTRTDQAQQDVRGKSGTITFIGEEIDKNTSLSTIHQGRLPQNVYVAYEAFLINASSVDGVDASPNSDAGYSPDQNLVDPAIRNGRFLIKQDDNIIFDEPVATLLSAGADNGNLRKFAYEVASPIVLEPGKKLEFQIQTASQVKEQANTSVNVEVLAYGIATRPKG